MTEREAVILSGVALLVAVLSAVWFSLTSWPGAGLMGLLFSGWAVMLLVRHAVRPDEES